MTNTDIELNQLLEIGIALSREKDPNCLLRTILEAAMEITSCDGGTLYILTENQLHFKMMITKSKNYYKGLCGEPIDLPAVALCPENVCAHAVLSGELINVPDVYNDQRFDFSGPLRYDAMTGYQTTSVLVVPMEDDYGDVIGVLQLINATNKDGKIIAFDATYQQVISSLASQAAIRLTTMNYSAEVVELLDSFVRVMSTAIDARSPYNANHTRNMAKYAERFLDWLQGQNHPWSFNQQEKRQLLMSIWLHDVGKLVIPLEVMDKETRLGSMIHAVEYRFETIRLLNKIDLLSNTIEQEEYRKREEMLQQSKDLVAKANVVSFLPDDLLREIELLSLKTYLGEDGRSHPWLEERERIALSVRKGTLTNEERAVMESHVLMTKKMLGEMKFSRNYAMVSEWASAHHEYIDGSGYPNQKKEEEIPREVRIITILDIFDALTARDRPYKPAMPVEKALGILQAMKNEGKLDGELLGLFIQSKAWEEPMQNEAKER